jgi:hypothetical protein
MKYGNLRLGSIQVLRKRVPDGSKIFVWEGKVESEFVWAINFIPPKRRFWKEEQKMKSGFSKHFSRT